MKQAITFVLGVLALGVGTRVSAQSVIPTRALPGVTSTLTGIVISATPRRLVVRDDGGVQHTIDLEVTSTLAAGLVPGTRASVMIQPLEGGRSRLVSVDTSTSTEVSPARTQPDDPANPPEPKPASDDRQSSEPARSPSNILVTATLALAVAFALGWARRVL